MCPDGVKEMEKKTNRLNMGTNRKYFYSAKHRHSTQCKHNLQVMILTNRKLILYSAKTIF